MTQKIRKEGEKLTSEQIDQLAREVKTFIERWGFDWGINLFYNGQRSDLDTEWTETTDEPLNYCEHVAKDHILTMTFEGAFFHFFSENTPCWIDADEMEDKKIELLIDSAGLQKEFYKWMADHDIPDTEAEKELFELCYENHEEFLIRKLEHEEQREWNRTQNLMPGFIRQHMTEIHRCARSEIQQIFERYGIEYEFGHAWSMTCFYSEQPWEYIETQD